MKLLRQTKVEICGDTWTVKLYDRLPDNVGGQFWWDRRLLKFSNCSMAPDVVMHEVLEIGMVGHCLRYQACNEPNQLFIMSHRDMTNVCMNTGKAMKELMDWVVK